MYSRFVRPVVASVVKRQSSTTSSSSASSSTCSPNNNSPECAKPVNEDSQNLAIILGIAIPLGVAAIILFVLHQRMRRRQKREEANDKHNSLDFGLADVPGGPRRGGRSPNMEITDIEKPMRSRGVSLDFSQGGHPYLLPGNLVSSRESIHSLSRSIQDQHDPYRPVNFLDKDVDSLSAYPNPMKLKGDGASTRTGNTGKTGSSTDDGSNLLRGAQRMSRSIPPRAESVPPSELAAEEKPPVLPAAAYVPQRKQSPAQPSFQTSSPPDSRQQSVHTSPYESRQPSRAPSETFSQPTTATHASTDATDLSEHSLNFFPSPKATDERSQLPPIHDDYQFDFTDSQVFDDSLKITPPSPKQEQYQHERYSIDAPQEHSQPTGLGVYNSELNSNRLSTHIRPLPPDDPLDNPEQRANRIRSFYREYFDDSKGGRVSYYEDYGARDSVGHGAPMFDPATGQFLVAGNRPYAQPVTRRAMTPPPRGPPRVRGRGSTASDVRSARTMTSAGGRGRLPPFAPKKQLPPPKDLMTLPTPHMLKDDSGIFNATDFAPRTTFRDTQAGRSPDSLRGGEFRPYSPKVGVHSPLVGAFDEIAALPSPHLLRKSGTFTSLDFLPPPKFRGSDAGSDAGSIRSNRSGISAMQANAVRQGAYRVSRIPKELVTTPDLLGAELKPQMSMINRA